MRVTILPNASDCSMASVCPFSGACTLTVPLGASSTRIVAGVNATSAMWEGDVTTRYRDPTSSVFSSCLSHRSAKYSPAGTASISNDTVLSPLARDTRRCPDAVTAPVSARLSVNSASTSMARAAVTWKAIALNRVRSTSRLKDSSGMTRAAPSRPAAQRMTLPASAR